MYYSKNEDTICAPATIPGTGAISIIRVSGPDAFRSADSFIRCTRGDISSAKGYTIKFGTASDLSNGNVIDEVLVSIFRAPHSYTGEDSVEISCHASSYIVSEIISQLHKAGVRNAAPGEFTQRAFLNGKMDLAQAEAVADVIASQNAAAHRIAFQQMKGGFSKELSQMRSSLLEIVSLMELELDFSEEEVEFADRSRLKHLVDASIGHISRLVDSFKAGNAIKNGVPVAIVGATNAGKSTLLNALLGEERAIVSDIHGTTRDTIEETMTLGGILFRFIDTAGLRETEETIERIGIERTLHKINEASIVLAMLDATADENVVCESLLQILSHIDFANQHLILILNKADAFENEGNVPIYSPNNFVMIANNIVSLIENKGIDTSVAPLVSISAKTGKGLDTLRTLLESSQKDILADTTQTFVTNARHVQELTLSLTALQRVRSGLDTTLPTDLLAQDLREALYHLGSITGTITTDEILGNIFQNFCIGK